VRADRCLILVLLLGLFALPAVPTTASMVCPMQEAQRATTCCGMARECSRAPVSFALGLAFDHGRRSAARDAVASPRSTALKSWPAEVRSSALPAVQLLPSRPFSLLSVWRI
jgi:hypothetical protein